MEEDGRRWKKMEEDGRRGWKLSQKAKKKKKTVVGNGLGTLVGIRIDPKNKFDLPVGYDQILLHN